MGFSKSFPKNIKGTTYPVWEEVSLNQEEEKIEEGKAKKENIRLMEECIDDAMFIIKDKKLKSFQSDMMNIAIALFEKRASHLVYWKESKAKEKFDEKNN